MPPPSLLQRLKERKLVQWGLAYLAGAFVVFQLLDALAEPLGLSTTIQRAVLAVVGAGFFITLILAWYHGEKGQQKASGAELLMVAAMLLIAGGVLALLGPREGTTSTGEAPIPSPPERDRPTLAVLPFDNMSAEADEDAAFFATGLHDDLITQLSKIAGLDVIARTSVMRYAGTDKPIPLIGQELGVGAVLEGSVMRAGEQVRLNVQLIDARTDTHLWADTYDRAYSVANVFSIQTDLVRHLARTLQAELIPAEEARIAKVPTESEEAYTFFLRGKDALDRAGWEPGDLALAREMLSRAVALDPGFALAHAGLSFTYTVEYWLYDRSEVWLERSRAAAEEALRLDPDLSQAHLSLAWHHYVKYEHEEAMDALRLAEHGLPGSSELMGLKSFIQTRLWQWDEALETLEHAARLDPQNAEAAFALGEAYGDRHRWEESDSCFDLAMEIDPSFYEAGLVKGYRYYLRTGDGGPALEFLAGIPPETEVFGLKGIFEWMFSASEAERIAALERIEQPILELGGFLWAPRELLEAWTYSEADPARARQAFEVAVAVCLAALDHQPDDASIHVTLGRAYAALGRREEAVQEARLSQELLPVTRDPTFGRELLSFAIRIYAQLGMVEETVEAIETFYSIPNPQLPEVFLPKIAYPAIRDDPRFHALLEKYPPDTED